MPRTLRSKEEKKATRHYATVMAFAVGCILGGWLILNHSSVTSYTAAIFDRDHQESTEVSEFDRSAPVNLRIPKIGLDAEFVPPLGLNDDQTVSVPDSYEKVGWYKHGATPGEIGPAVILGHVDSYEGPAVFFSLGQLKSGDEIEVDREDGTTAIFVVDEIRRYDQQDFPTELVYGQIKHAGLRLVTCTGTFNRGIQRYSHNLVVYASLKKE
jgi:sortase (surface protein transpeptidase)